MLHIDRFRRELKKDLENETLIEMAQQLVYHENELDDIANKNNNDEILQEDMVNLSLHMANDYLNQDRPNLDNTSPLQDTRDYFNDNFDNIANEYFSNTLKKVKLKPTTTTNPHQESAANTCRLLRKENENYRNVCNDKPEFELEIYRSITETLDSASCNSWCQLIEASELIDTKLK